MARSDATLGGDDSAGSGEHNRAAGSAPLRGRGLAADWRARAVRLDEFARRCRREGDTRQAEDAEAAAVDYRQAADDLELRSPEFHVEITLGNDAMLSKDDALHAIRNALTRRLHYAEMHRPLEPGEEGAIMDGNGNKVGRWFCS